MDQTERGRCPRCSKSVSLLQAAWYGAGRPFKCRGCGSLIEKTSVRYFVIAPLILVVLYIGREFGGGSVQFWGSFAGACLVIAMDAKLFCSVRLSGGEMKS
ncbi:hypothetical protein [Brevundimonas aurantiaca]|uniref:hypothetical protein n=1 Tax=Brevundimonas aurantiaca TaxID=74316 RepID=UPI00174DEF5B|nr:hypothetical protein [Brevundimonas aurantiaca]